MLRNIVKVKLEKVRWQDLQKPRCCHLCYRFLGPWPPSPWLVWRIQRRCCPVWCCRRISEGRYATYALPGTLPGPAPSYADWRRSAVMCLNFIGRRVWNRLFFHWLNWMSEAVMYWSCDFRRNSKYCNRLALTKKYTKNGNNPDRWERKKNKSKSEHWFNSCVIHLLIKA